MEIVPGIVWEYHAPLWEHYALRHSRIVSDKNGILVEGEINEVHMTLHEYGFTVSGRDGQGGMKCVAAMEALKRRVEAKLKQEQLRRL